MMFPKHCMFAMMYYMLVFTVSYLILNFTYYEFYVVRDFYVFSTT